LERAGVPIGRELARFGRWESLGQWRWPELPLYREGGQEVPTTVEFRRSSGGMVGGVVVDSHPTLPTYLVWCPEDVQMGGLRMLYQVFPQPGGFVGESAFYVDGRLSMGGLGMPPVWTRLGGRMIAHRHSPRWTARAREGERRFWPREGYGGYTREQERMAMEDFRGELRSIRKEQDRVLLVRRQGGSVS
jgi:hypothetical protein